MLSCLCSSSRRPEDKNLSTNYLVVDPRSPQRQVGKGDRGKKGAAEVWVSQPSTTAAAWSLTAGAPGASARCACQGCPR